MPDDGDRLRRWEDAGGTWRVLAGGIDRVTVGFCRCDGGEEVDRLTTTDAGALAHIGGRETSEESGGEQAD